MENLTKQQKDFLRNYAHTLNATKSALDGGYSDNVAHVQAKNLLSRKKYQKALNAIIEREVDKLEIPKAFILKKYLQVIDYASGECERQCGAEFEAGREFGSCATNVAKYDVNNKAESGSGSEFSGSVIEGAPQEPVRDFCEPKDPALLLKAIEGLQRFLERAKEEPKNEDITSFWQIDNVDCNKI